MKLLDVNLLPEDSRPHIGSTFISKRGAEVKVVGWIGKESDGSILFAVKCETCTKVSDLKEEVIFYTGIRQLIDGYTVCGCNNRKQTVEQKIRGMNKILQKVQPTLTAIGFELKGKKYVYLLECSICSKDKELFPDGSLRGYKGNLERGQQSCGCSPTYKWDERQTKVRIKRRIEGSPVKFHGWVGDTFKGVSTQLKLEDTSLGVCWVSSTVTNFLRQKGNPPALTGVQKAGHIDKLFSEFVKNLPDKECYKPNYENSKYVYYYCPICKEDELVKKGLCTGIFNVLKPTVKRGGKPCRCSQSFSFTKRQREYLVKEKIREKGGTFIGWEKEDSYTWDALVKWCCKEGHECSTIVNSIMRGTGCGTCFKKDTGMYGFYKNKTKYKDTLYVISFNDEYIKVGRTFNLESRLKSLSRQARVPVTQLRVLFTHKGSHLRIFNLEQDLHKELRLRGFEEKKVTWSQELFTYDSLDCIKYLFAKTE